MFNFNEMMSQVQELQKQMSKAEEMLTSVECTGEAGAGLVKVTVNGKHEARRVEIDPSLMTEDKEVLEDLIVAALNDAARRVEEASKARLSSFAKDFMPK